MRKTSRKGWVRMLDKIVSDIVIKRDGLCVCCGSKRNITAGHVFSRVAYSTRWDLTNVYAQCWPCNYRQKIKGDSYPIQNYFIEIWGRAKLDKLHKKYVTLVKYKNYQLEELFNELKGVN